MVRSKKAATRRPRQAVEGRALRRLEFGPPQLTSTPMPSSNASDVRRLSRRSAPRTRRDASSSEEVGTLSPERPAIPQTSAAANRALSRASATLQRSANVSSSAAANRALSRASATLQRSANVSSSAATLHRNTSAMSAGPPSRRTAPLSVSTRTGSPNSRTRRRRFRPGTRALLEIRKYQKSTALLLRKLPFSRVVRDVSREVLSRQQMQEFRWQAVALSCLQEAAEAFLVQMFDNAQRCAIHGHRKTVMVRDLWLLHQLHLL